MGKKKTQGKENRSNRKSSRIRSSEKDRNKQRINADNNVIVKEYQKGSVLKSKKALINIALVYPNTYHTGMSNLGFQSVYALFNSNENVLCHRFFLPDKYNNYSISDKHSDCNNQKQQFNIEADHSAEESAGSRAFEIKSFQTAVPLSSCDLIAFSVSFENDYINILSILKNSNIPLRTSKRDSSYPFIIAGGVACFINPEPIAPFIDCFLLGEAEEMLPAFLNIFISFHNIKNKNLDLNLCKREIALNIKGAYIPEFYNPSYDSNGNFLEITPIYHDIPKRAAVQHLNDLSKTTTTTHILTQDTAFNNTFLIEIGRGCHHGCRFCSAGFIYRPARFYSYNTIIDAVDEAKLFTDKIGLVSPTLSDHPDINKICAAAINNKLQIGFSSLRLDALTDAAIENLVKSSVKTATIAPEAGSQRMRNIINKKISEEQILSAAARLVEHGIINLKLYFMVGLPFEKDDDVKEIVALTKKIKEIFLDKSKKNKKIGTITLSINPFIPKPNTPFQWCAMDSVSNFKNKTALIKNGLKKTANIVINTEPPKTALINAMLSRGDRQMADILEKAVSDKENPKNFFKYNRQTLLKNSNNMLSQIELDAPLPWDIVDTGIKKEFLIKEFRRAELEKTSPDCPMVDCNGCGVCRL